MTQFVSNPNIVRVQSELRTTSVWVLSFSRIAFTPTSNAKFISYFLFSFKWTMFHSVTGHTFTRLLTKTLYYEFFYASNTFSNTINIQANTFIKSPFKLQDASSTDLYQDSSKKGIITEGQFKFISYYTNNLLFIM